MPKAIINRRLGVRFTDMRNSPDLRCECKSAARQESLGYARRGTLLVETPLTRVGRFNPHFQNFRQTRLDGGATIWQTSPPLRCAGGAMLRIRHLLTEDHR
jgi:hypothetical protein